MIGIQPMAAQFRLSALLKAKQLSQSELARRSGVSLVTINAIANNRTRQVKLDTLDALSAVLGVKPGDLLETVKPEKKGRGKVK